jgi:hypothetical protein
MLLVRVKIASTVREDNSSETTREIDITIMGRAEASPIIKRSIPWSTTLLMELFHGLQTADCYVLLIAFAVVSIKEWLSPAKPMK